MVGLSLDAIAELAQFAKRKTTAPLIYYLRTQQFTDEGDEAKRTEFLTWWLPLQESAGRLAAWEVISRLIVDGGLLEAVARWPRGEEAVSNLRKLQQMAGRESHEGPQEFADRISALQGSNPLTDASTVGPDVNAALVTTIHQAKGLEWPVVVVADAHHRRGARVEDKQIDLTEAVFTMPMPPGQGRPEGQKLTLQEILTSEKAQKGKEEAKRLLYVALTRAKKRLHIILNEQPEANTAEQLILSTPVGKQRRKEFQASRG
jgi:ATP-dependent exoDNAse (exonuclease V) beta subunit